MTIFVFRLKRWLTRSMGLVMAAVLGVTQLPVWAALPSAVQGQAVPSLAPMLEGVTPAIVNIATRGQVLVQDNPLLRDPFFRRFFEFPGQPRARNTSSLGSGVIVDAKKGFIVTNHHVIDKAQEITVTLRDGRRLTAELVGADPDTDVAVIKVPADGLHAVPLADSEKVRVGDFVVAIGNPFGLGQTVTSGIISALGRSGLGIQGYENFIQTDASINVGNSGGALVDLNGRLVGINTAILAPGGRSVGIGFAIPTNMVRRIMDQLVAYGKVQRGLLGVATQDLTAELAQAFGTKQSEGAIVVEIAPGSPAAVAGLQAGDIVTSVGKKPVRKASDLRNAIGLLGVGDPIELTVMRNGERRLVRAVLGARHIEEGMDGRTLSSRLEGATFTDITEGSSLFGRIEGVLVAEVGQGSLAWRYGLRDGDVITSANRQRVRNLGELRTAGLKNAQALTLKIQRGSGSVFVLIQ